MNPLLTLDADDLRRFQSDGKAFTRQVDGAIRASAAQGGIEDADLATNLRVSIKDGGVDTRVDAPCKNDPSGRFGCPTIWQYKSGRIDEPSSAKTLDDLQKEVNKPYSAQKIREGYGYRIVICQSLTAKQKQTWEDTLTAAVRALEPAAPGAKVVTADDLAAWLSEFPALVVEHRGLDLGDFQTFASWRDNVTKGPTPHYVPVDAWKTQRAAITAYCSLTATPRQGIFTLLGFAGVGKTRLVFETLQSLPGAASLVVYTSESSRALELVRRVVNLARSTVVIVADECPLDARQSLEELLRDPGRRQRIRIIAIEATQASRADGFLPQMPTEILTEILAKNYPHVPPDRRAAYARLAKGYVRFATDLCSEDPIAQGLRVSGGGISDYLDARISREESRVALFALAMVARLGWRDDKAEELDDLCRALHLGEPTEVLARLREMKEPPGFVAEAGRYLYVTPEIVAHWAFARGWARWAERDTKGFVEGLPSTLLTAFQERVVRSAERQVRRLVGETFRGWVEALRPIDLRDLGVVERLVKLVDTDPGLLFRHVVELVKGATASELDSGSLGRWGARSELVWLAERMATGAAHFELAEQLLRHLALGEPRSEFDNDASEAWKRLFSITLSGTPIPFEWRFRRLRQIHDAGETSTRRLALDAIQEALDFERGRFRRQGSLSLISVSEPEWKPRGIEELRACLELLVDFLSEEIDSASDHAHLVVGALVSHSVKLIDMGFADVLRRILEPEHLDDSTRADLIHKIDLILRDPREVDEAQRDTLRQWSMELAGEGIDGLLLRHVGQWVLEPEELEHRRGLASLASAFVEEPALLSRYLGWLGSDAAVNPAPLGEYMGQRDSEAACLGILLDAALDSRRTSLVRGYVWGLLHEHPSQSDDLNARLDVLERVEPEFALDVATVGRDSVHAASRAIRLVEARELPATVLTSPGFWNRENHVTDEQAATFTMLLARACVEEPETSDPAVKLLWVWLHKPEGRALLERDDFMRSAWEIVAVRSRMNAREDMPWSRVLGAMGQQDPGRAAAVAACGLASESLHMARYAEELLVELVELDPEAVMVAVGGVLFEDSEYLAHRRLKRLFAAIPDDVLVAWIERHGVEAARRSARHLPAPYLRGGEPVVPRVTAFVLDRFEDDERVFAEFTAGVHGAQLYAGDIAGEHDREVEVARAFAEHPLRRVREWAGYEEQSASRAAERGRQRDAERSIAHG